MADPDTPTAEAPQQAIALPLTFANSFHSADYRTGLTALFDALSAAETQSDELRDHVQRRADLEAVVARGMYPPALRADGFAADDGGSLRMGFEAVLTSEVSEARARQALSEDLQRTILHPFTSWSASHSARLSSSRHTLFAHLSAFESALSGVNKLKGAYHDACRLADEVEDEVLFSRAKEEVDDLRRRRRRVEGGEGAVGVGGVAGGGAGGGAEEALPPRPDEIDAELQRQRQRQERQRDDDEQSEEGVSQYPSDDDEVDEGPDAPLKSPTATAAAGVMGALGRAFSVRKPQGTGAQGGTGGRGARGAVEGEGEQGEGEEEAKGEGIKKLVESDEVRKGVERARSTFSSLLSRANASVAAAAGLNLNLPAVAFAAGSGEERMLKTRRAADEAEERYKGEVERCEGLRLTLDAALSSHLPYLHRCETDRLRAAQSVLRSFHAAVSALPRAVVDSQERVKGALEGLGRAERDVRGVIERRRTGPFQPRPVLFTSHYADPPLTTFGIDLRKFDETNPRGQGAVPPVVEFLVRWVEEQGDEVGEEERRKSWLYETPLSAQHRLRQLLNSPSTLALPYSSLSSLLSRPHPSSSSPDDPTQQPIDLPVACSTLKLWLLELEVPVVTWERYDELRALWGGVGRVGEEAREGVDREEVARVVGKLPKVHYEVLKLIITHLHRLIHSTPSAPEPASTYIHKLSLSLSRALVRPRTETALTLDDRFPSHFVALLLAHGVEEVFPRAEEMAKREREERYRPRRQRTKPMDVRPTRARLGLGEKESVDLGKAGEILKAQGQAQGSAPSPVKERLRQLAVAGSGAGGEKKPAEEEKVEQDGPAATAKRQSLLGVDTTVGGASLSPGGGGGMFAASPMSATAEELPPPPPPPASKAPVDANDAGRGKGKGKGKEVEVEEKRSVPRPEGATEEPFVPPGATEEPFVPPQPSAPPLAEDDGDTDEAPSSSADAASPPAPSAPPAADEDSAPLAPSSSLKRASGTGRLRGARAPRPPSQSIAGKMAAFEQGEGAGGGGGKRESWTRTVPSAPPARDEGTDAE